MKTRRNDILLFCMIICFSLLFWGIARSGREKGQYVVVTVNGTEQGRYPLDRPEEFEIVTDYGTNHLVIDDGKASVTEADCPDRLCVKQKEISRDGETIVCLPHRLTVAIEGGSSGAVDGISD